MPITELIHKRYKISTDDKRIYVFLDIHSPCKVTITNPHGQPFNFVNSNLNMVRNICQLIQQAVLIAQSESIQQGD